LTTCFFVQTYNSLNQSPCKVAAYLASTCAGGSESFSFCVYEHGPNSSPTAFTVTALGVGQEYTGPSVLGGGDICKCNTVYYSLMSACGACQDALWIEYAFVVSFFISYFIYLPIVGLHGQPTVRRFRLLGREFPVATTILLPWNRRRNLAPQVSKPCPARDECTTMGSPRRHSSFYICHFPTRTNATPLA
jgi:hypothetical protein